MTDPNATQIRHSIGADGAFDLRNVSGRVRLSGTDGDEVIVNCRSQRGGEPRLNVERGPGHLLVEPQRDRGGMFGLGFDRAGGMDFDVQLPRSARLDVKTVSADVEVHGLIGEQSYKTVSADLRLSQPAGRIRFMTVSGDVRLHAGGEVTLDGATTSGDVTVEAARVGQLGLRTVSGDVRVEGRLQPGPRHSVETVSGDLSLDIDGGVRLDSRRALDLGRERGPAVIGDGSASVFFRSMSGEHRVTLRSTPPTAAADAERPAQAPAPDRIEVLRALERGEIDVDEASRLLEAR